MFVLFARLIQSITRRTEVYIGVTALICIFLGALLFAHFEHRSFWQSLYWCITTASTVGYGDIAPTNTIGQVIAIGVMITCIPLFGALFSMMAARIAEAKIRRLVGMEHVGLKRNHVLVLGSSDETLTVIAALKDVSSIVLVADDIDASAVPVNVSYIKGDPRDPNVLAKARPNHAKHAIITGVRDGDILETAIALKEIVKDIPVTVSTRSALASRALQALGINRTLIWQELLGHTLAKSLQAPHAGELLMQMVNSDEFVIDEVPVPREMVGKPFRDVRSAHKEYVLGLAQENEIVLGIRRDPVVQEGSTLLILKPKA
ncbi:ion channel [Alicyclobacillus mengziensis]|uniref:NAD-binding protein n=1 Tax=Alicyclobacillus mengziensis TaxID=2931921 RepID=A0A9X7Z5R7_9BACL|nr:potassium channel family protein [Alicyclobacillus mengziensis]QSO45556.1 NAD-binding protein [Alicyclobacillus mengziensis]